MLCCGYSRLTCYPGWLCPSGVSVSLKIRSKPCPLPSRNVSFSSLSSLFVTPPSLRFLRYLTHSLSVRVILFSPLLSSILFHFLIPLLNLSLLLFHPRLGFPLIFPLNFCVHFAVIDTDVEILIVIESDIFRRRLPRTNSQIQLWKLQHRFWVPMMLLDDSVLCLECSGGLRSQPVSNMRDGKF